MCPSTSWCRTDGKPSRWPTFGIKLSAKPDDHPKTTVVKGPLSLTFGMLATLVGWNDRSHIDDPSIVARTIFVNTFGISAVAFDLSRADQDRLYKSGRDAATKFLDTWDFSEYASKHPNIPEVTTDPPATPA